jgi:uncharacterized DUF497 family protein
MKIVWDEPKRLSNLVKHGYDFADLTEDFFEAGNDVAGHSDRRLIVGQFHRRLIVVVFRSLGHEAVSIISMREANRKDIERYEQAISKLQDR